MSTGHHSQIRFNIYIDPLNKLFKMTAYFIALSFHGPIVFYRILEKKDGAAEDTGSCCQVIGFGSNFAATHRTCFEHVLLDLDGNCLSAT